MTEPKDPDGPALPTVGQLPEGAIAQFIITLLQNDERPCVIQMPVDITDQEVLSLVRGVLDVTDVLRSQRPKAPGAGLIKAPPGLRIQH